MEYGSFDEWRARRCFDLTVDPADIRARWEAEKAAGVDSPAADQDFMAAIRASGFLANGWHPDSLVSRWRAVNAAHPCLPR